MKSVSIKDKEFDLFLSEEQIKHAIVNIADKMNTDLKDKDPLFICVLNGSFMFAAELLKQIETPCKVSFVRISSYHGIGSTGEIKEIYGLNEDLKDRTIVILEDIVDTGFTMSKMIEKLNLESPKEIKIATLLFKPHALKESLHIDYAALEIPNDFIVGYGLDYDGYGRNLANIYKIKS